MTLFDATELRVAFSQQKQTATRRLLNIGSRTSSRLSLRTIHHMRLFADRSMIAACQDNSNERIL